MTTYGLAKLKAELEDLQKNQRPDVIEAIEEARAHGDLKENAEYHAAKERQGFIEGRIAEIEGKMANATIVDPEKVDQDKIVLGATVKMVDVDSDKEVTYVLVGPEEADIDLGLISVTSPIGRALIGKQDGDEVTVRAPGGEHVYEILDFEYKAIKV